MSKHRITASEASELTNKAIKDRLLYFEKYIQKIAKGGEDSAHTYFSNVSEPEYHPCLTEWVSDMSNRGFFVNTNYDHDKKALVVEVSW